MPGLRKIGRREKQMLIELERQSLDLKANLSRFLLVSMTHNILRSIAARLC